MGDGREALLDRVPVADDGRDFEHQHAEVEADAHRHFPQRRVDVPKDEAVPEAVGAADVEQQHHHSDAIADEADVDGRLGHRLKLLAPRQVGDGRDAEGAGAQGDGRQIDGDPQPPGHQVGQVGDPQPLGKDDQRRAHTDSHEAGQEEHPLVDRLAQGGQGSMANEGGGATNERHEALSSRAGSAGR